MKRGISIKRFCLTMGYISHTVTVTSCITLMFPIQKGNTICLEIKKMYLITHNNQRCLFQMACDKKPPEGCKAFVDVNNMVTCDAAAMNAFIKVAKEQ